MTFSPPVAECLNFIGGAFVPSLSRRTFANHQAATDVLFAEASRSQKEDVQMAVEACQKALEQSRWHKWSLAERAHVLKKLADLIEENQQSLAKLESMDTGKPIFETLNGDIPRAALNFRSFADFATAQPEEVYTGKDASQHRITRQALGIVGLITPWNLPLYLETWKLAPALIQGNAVILKPAELSPMTANALAALSIEAGLPQGIFNIVHGFGAGEAGEALVTHPQVKAISFTGESATGVAIMKAAAPYLKKLSFELGGKGLSLVHQDADLKTAVPMIFNAAFRNQGQICLAGSRLLIHRSLQEQVVEELCRLAHDHPIGDPLDPNTRMGSLISKEHRRKVMTYVDLAREQSCKIHCGGRIPAAHAERGAFFEPTIISGMEGSSRLIQEEIFGPVLCVQGYDDLDQAITMANDTPYGLSASVWSRDQDVCQRVSEALDFGLIWQNTWFLRDLRSPFGGMKKSGLGREGGRYSLEFFSESKTVSKPAYSAISASEHQRRT